MATVTMIPLKRCSADFWDRKS